MARESEAKNTSSALPDILRRLIEGSSELGRFLPRLSFITLGRFIGGFRGRYEISEIIAAIQPAVRQVKGVPAFRVEEWLKEKLPRFFIFLEKVR